MMQTHEIKLSENDLILFKSIDLVGKQYYLRDYMDVSEFNGIFKDENILFDSVMSLQDKGLIITKGNKLIMTIKGVYYYFRNISKTSRKCVYHSLG